MQVVVAHFRESLEWLTDVLRIESVASIGVYHKGEVDFAETNPLVTHFFLTNLGREGHTYFHHIVENYDRLHDFTAFVQGYPFDHSADLLNKLSKTQTASFTWLSERLIQFNFLRGCDHHPGLPLTQVYRQLFDSDPPSYPVIFGEGAQFIVSRARIRQRPKAFYQRIVDMLGAQVNPIEGFVIERLHPLIFSE